MLERTVSHLTPLLRNSPVTKEKLGRGLMPLREGILEEEL